ncbi:hypothetical protein C8A05DRAFT_37809, partial [Staphylotrichum tortipilum]
MASPPRQYKRYSPQAWNAHRDTVRELVVEQGKKYDEIAAILKAEHDFDIGVRQLKRWVTEKWGMFRNIPDAEMIKMARLRRRRRLKFGRRTKFLRRQGAGEFQEVPSAKLDAYEKRVGARPGSPNESHSSQSSGLASNIIYRTPSDRSLEAPHSPTASIPPSGTESVLDFGVNSPTDGLFSENGNLLLSGPSSPSPHTPRDRSRYESTLQKRALEDALEGNYQAAARTYKLTAVPSALWQRAVRQFRIDVIEAAAYPGCPQTLTARVTDILSTSLTRERERHHTQQPSPPSPPDESSLSKTLISLHLESLFWSHLLRHQRALSLWEPLLGPSHPKITHLRAHLAKLRTPKTVPSDFARRTHRLQDSTDLLTTPPPPDQHAVRNLLHLPSSGAADALLAQAQALTSASPAGQQARNDIAWLRYGRSKALLGVCASFLRRDGEAQHAFGVSEAQMEREMCVEMRLYRTL